MRKPLKIILSILASALILGIVTVVSVPFVIDLNDFKTQIEAAVHENTGRTLSIEGEISLSVFPWLGITTEKMTLSNVAAFKTEPFAQISQSQIKVKLIPLFFKEIQISEIVLKGLNLNLHKKPNGESNWDDLAALIKNSQNQSENPLKLLEIAGISIEDAQIIWDNQPADQKFEFKQVNLKTDKLVFNQPIEIIGHFTENNPHSSLIETLNFSSDLSVDENLETFSFKKIKLTSTTEGKAIPSGKLVATAFAEAIFDLKQHTFTLSPLQIKTAGVTLSSSALTISLQQAFKAEGLIHIPNFDAAEFMRRYLAIQLPPMVDEKALTWLAADFHLSIDADHAKVQNLALQLDETLLEGFVDLHNFTEPAIHFNLTLDTVNFDRYLPPTDTKQISQRVTLPVGTKLAANASLFPLELFKKLNLNGQLTIDDLKINNLTMQGVRFLLNAKNGQLQSQQSVNRFYQGAYNGKLILDVNGDLPVLSLNQQLSHIQIEPLLSDLNGQSQFAGLIDMTAKLEATGNSHAALQSSLNGRLNFLVKDLLIRGFNLQKVVDHGKILLSNPALPNENNKDQTAFFKTSGTAIISQGILSNNDLSAFAAKTKVGGWGIINLVSQQLDYKIIAILLKEKITTTQTRVINNLPVFINIGGTLNAPAYQVDLAAMGVGL